MKKNVKFISILLSIALLVSSLSSFTSFAGSIPAYVKDGYYYRWSNGAYIQCIMNYDDLINMIQQDILDYNGEDDTFRYSIAAPSSVNSNTLEDNIENSIFTNNENDPRLGQYLASSVDIITCSASQLMVEYDTPVEVDGSLKQYYAYTLIVTVERNYDNLEELYVSEFARLFSNDYIPAGASDYEKVKIIYDMICRNTEYDYKLYNDENHTEYQIDSSRFRISHSAYGAIIGNQVANSDFSLSSLISITDTDSEVVEKISSQAKFDYSKYFASKTAINGQKIVKLETSDNGQVKPNGLAVCEGYSKLFYYLCVYNGIQSRIVDGDYVEYISDSNDEIESLYGTVKSGKSSDPHEWNYVKLNDGSGDKWYIVDVTFASQNSIKSIDLNNYDYFLIGTGNPTFSVKNHQQPYVKDGPIPQLYDWYVDDNKASITDYNIPLVNLNDVEIGANQIIIERKTDYDDATKYAYILQRENEAIKITLDEELRIIQNKGGFEYNGKINSEYRLIIPYFTGDEYVSIPLTNIANAGSYSVKTVGKKVDGVDSSFAVKFNIVPFDMSSGSKNEYKISTFSNYNGNTIEPFVSIIDGYGNTVPKNYYSLSVKQNGANAVLKEMGTYNITINFKDNYKGSYNFNFTIGKIDISKLNLNEYRFTYIPKYYREKEEIKSAADYFNKGVSGLSVGTVMLKNDIDYTVSSSGNLAYNDSGTITITSKSNSSNVVANKALKTKYLIYERFDIKNRTNLSGNYADSNKTNRYFYTGSAIKPTKFDNLDKYLVKGTDYKITSYSNNVNAGNANVTISGINGCKGTITMKFKINPADITKSKVTAKYSSGKLSVKVEQNGKTLVKGTDYSLSYKTYGNIIKVKISGINNYNGIKYINVDKTSSYIKPTAKGNKVKLENTRMEYTGKSRKPKVRLINGNGKTVNSYYYTVSYSSNVKIGKATATLKFRNGYSGKITVSFYITPKATSISSISSASKGFKVSWKKQSVQTTGYQIQYATKSDFSKASSFAIAKNTITSAKRSKLKSKTKYYVRIRTYKNINGKSYVSNWSSVKTVVTK